LANEYVRRNSREATHYLEDLCERLGPSARAHVIASESPSLALLDLAEESRADLVLVSAHGRTAAHHPYGSAITEFINYGNRPLFIVQDLPELQPRLSSAEAIASPVNGRNGLLTQRALS
jgi:nucleotide-binding universal stress UspA family protein